MLSGKALRDHIEALVGSFDGSTALQANALFHAMGSHGIGAVLEAIPHEFFPVFVAWVRRHYARTDAPFVHVGRQSKSYAPEVLTWLRLGSPISARYLQYGWIRVRRQTEETYDELARHHEAETKFLIEEVRRLAELLDGVDPQSSLSSPKR